MEPTPSTSFDKREVTRALGIPSDDSEFDSSEDDYLTDDSNTFGLDLQDQYPIKGVTLHTDNIRDEDNPGVVGSGAIDQWITFLLLQFNRRKVQNFTLLKHIDGPGKVLEEVIRCITVSGSWGRPWWSNSLTDNKYKRKWLEFADALDPISEGLRVQVRGGEDYNVVHHLQPVSKFYETMTCACALERKRQKVHYTLKITKLRDIEKTLIGKVPTSSIGGLRHCRRCRQRFVCQGTKVPDNSWILVQEVAKNSAVKYNDFQRQLRFGDANWNLAYITLTGPAYGVHDPLYSSIHFISHRAFYYHGERFNGKVRTLTDPRVVEFLKIERAFYLRVPE